MPKRSLDYALGSALARADTLLGTRDEVDRLAARGIVVSSRENNLRMSPHFCNNHADIERVLEGLRANRDLLA